MRSPSSTGWRRSATINIAGEPLERFGGCRTDNAGRSDRKEKQATMRRNFLVLALAMAISHFACGADNNANGGNSPEPVAASATKQTDNNKIRVRNETPESTGTL